MKKFVTHASRRQISPNWLQDFFRRYTFLSLLGLSIVAGMLFGLTVAYQASMTEEAQQVVALANYRPNLVTRVLAADGKTVIGEFSVERRIPITYDEIPNKMKEAIWAIEDDRFFQHIGVDPIRVTMAAYKNVIQGRKAEGASTLTQQLARNLFLSSEKTYERKIKEILLSLQIERYYTKEQIMEMYCNQIFLGGGSYGFEAGAQYYFSKPLKELSLEESAMLDGCNRFSALCRVVLPLAAPGVAATAIFAFVASWSELLFAITFTSQTEMRTLSAGLLFMVGQYEIQWGQLSAGVMISTVPVAILFTYLQRHLIRGLSAGALKG